MDTATDSVDDDVVVLGTTAPSTRYRRLCIHGGGSRRQVTLRLAGVLQRIHAELP